MTNLSHPPIWALQDAKAKFSELVTQCEANGPQIVSKRGVETVVVVPLSQWKDLQARARPTLKEWLLAPEPRIENMNIPPRGNLKWREPPVFE